MTPNEFYALPAISTDPWHAIADEVVQQLLKIEPWGYGEDFEEVDTGRLVVQTKLHHNVDGERSVSMRAFYFDGKPFAMTLSGGRGEEDARDEFVTDTDLWREARDHVVALTSRDLDADQVVSVDADFLHHFYGTSIARFGDGVRLVSSNDIHPFTNSAVYDMEKFNAQVDRVIRPLAKKIGIERCAEDPRMQEAAAKAYRAGVIGESVDLDIDLGGQDRIVAASIVDGQTFAHVMKPRGNYLSWLRDIDSKMVGPASMLDCYADIAAGREPTVENAYVQEASAAFGADPHSVRAELCDFLVNGGRSMAERIVNTLPRDPRIPESIVDGYPSFAIGHMVKDNPALTAFCSNGYPSLTQAEELVEAQERIAGHIAAREARKAAI